MKKVLPKILISVILVGIFLLPISPFLKLTPQDLSITISENITSAQTPPAANPPPLQNEDYTGDDKGNVEFGCGLNPLTWFTNCLVATFYYIIFQPIALFAKIAAKILDFFVYYSINSDSYTSSFIDRGWKAVRDIANIFFIIALLYVAIKIILSLDEGHSKKLIGTIVVIALLINFSLFFTKVVIDSSNILAKIFYNGLAPIDSNGGTKPPGENKEKSITVKLVATLGEPQNILDKSGYPPKNNPGKTIFVIVLMLLLMLYMIYIFLSVAFLFVGRVVSLWISMIFAPIAFASYTLPFDIPGLGHKEWWKNLFENAFLAPIFIFLLYLVLMFADFVVPYKSADDSWTNALMGILIPFAITAILLKKAKDMAVKYSGEMGAAMQKVGGMVAGAALGVATGGAALAMRGTLGAAGNMMANSTALAKMETTGKVKMFGKEFNMGRLGRTVGTGARNVGTAAGKGSFDIRGISVGGKSLASTGMSNMKAGGQGGYVKSKADKAEKRQKRADELKAVMEKGKKGKEVKKLEEDLKGLENALNPQLEKIDKDIEIAKEKLQNVKGVAGKEQETEKLYAELKKKQNEKDALRGGFEYNSETGEIEKERKQVLNPDGTPKKQKVVKEFEEDETKDVTITDPTTGTTRIEKQPTGKKITVMRETGEEEDVYEYENKKKKDENGNNIKSIKGLTEDIKNGKNEITKEQNQIALDYANKITKRKLSNLFGLSNAANKEAAHNIKMGVKVEAKH